MHSTHDFLADTSQLALRELVAAVDKFFEKDKAKKQRAAQFIEQLVNFMQQKRLVVPGRVDIVQRKHNQRLYDLVQDAVIHDQVDQKKFNDMLTTWEEFLKKDGDLKKNSVTVISDVKSPKTVVTEVKENNPPVLPREHKVDPENLYKNLVRPENKKVQISFDELMARKLQESLDKLTENDARAAELPLLEKAREYAYAELLKDYGVMSKPALDTTTAEVARIKFVL